MAKLKKEIRVSTHVGRDLLSSAAAFKTETAAVWEYVANSLQYTEPGIPPVVQVAVDASDRTISISDNGRGMSVDDLEHFFQMHGENLERLSGRPGRGKFGTGKSAAFGIGNRLTIETCRGGVRNVVELSRKDIDRSTGDDIPVTWLVRDEPSAATNGTMVTIGEIFLSRLRRNEIIEYIERNLQAFRAQLPSVAVNDHVCSYRAPEVVVTRSFTPSATQAALLGECTLTIHVARVPLSEPELGILVTAGHGNAVGHEDCGVSRKEFGNYLFGDIDVPAIETYSTPIQPFDDSRSLRLNPEHPVVRTLIGFIGSKLEEVRGEQARAAREAQKTEQMRRLARQADSLADILNEDFKSLRDRLDHIRASSSSRGPARSLFGRQEAAGSDSDAWMQGTQERGTIEAADRSSGSRKEKTARTPNIGAAGQLDSQGKSSVDPAGGDGKKQRTKGGFEVAYEHLGREEQRSTYDRTRMAILINLDHPAVANALKAAAVEDPVFKRLSYEIAFSEYSMVLGYELVRQDPDMPADDLLYEVRATLNRLATAAAALYLS
jgi:hypothetical protein